MLSKKESHVGLQDPLHFALVDGSVEASDGVMGAASTPKTIRAVQKVLLVHGLQHFGHGTLDNLVLQRRDPNRSRRPIILGDVHPSDRLMSITLRLHPLVQLPEVALQILPVILLGDSIHAHRGVLSDAAVGPPERRDID